MNALMSIVIANLEKVGIGALLFLGAYMSTCALALGAV